MNSQLNDVTNLIIIEQEEIFPLNYNTSTVINYTMKKITEWMKGFLQDIEFNSESLFFYIFPVGSLTYHKPFPDNPKDFLLCFPGVIKIHQIYESLVQFLNKTGNFQIITILHSRYVPVLELMISNVTIDLLICFIPYQYCLTKKPVFNLRNPPQCLLDKMDLKSIFALNSLRNSLLIRDYLGDLFSVYQETLLHLKKWAVFKLIYFKSSSKFLNGTSLSIMLASTFRKTTVMPTVMSSLCIFFRHYAELNWSKRAISINLENFVDNMHEIVMKNPEFITPKNNVITILTPAIPYQNCAKSINKLALDRIVHYFREAYYLFEKNCWKLSLDSQLMTPLTLIDFIGYANHARTTSPQIVLISIVEEKLLENTSLFCEFEELIKMKLKTDCSNENVLYYPLAIRNVLINKSDSNQLRVRYFVLLNYNTNIKWSKSNIVNIADKDLPSGIKYTVESVADNDFRISSLNFDNMEKIIRLLYTGA